MSGKIKIQVLLDHDYLAREFLFQIQGGVTTIDQVVGAFNLAFAGIPKYLLAQGLRISESDIETEFLNLPAKSINRNPVQLDLWVAQLAHWGSADDWWPRLNLIALRVRDYLDTQKLEGYKLTIRLHIINTAFLEVEG